MKLSDVILRKTKATDKVQEFADGGGLYLYVAPTGGKLWRMDYRFEGKRKTLSFGSYPVVSLKEAHARRDDAKAKIANGIDPGAEKKRPSLNKIKSDSLMKSDFFLWSNLYPVLIPRSPVN